MKVAVLLGGVGPEREISRRSGESVLAALSEAAWEAVAVEVTEDGRFALGEDPSLSPPASIVSPAAGIEHLREAGVEAVFVALHGTYGEDGVIQGFLDAVGMPYAGSGVEGSALAMNKQVSRLVMADAGVPVAAGRLLRSGISLAGYEPPLPAVVKPCSLGSSVGVKLVRNREDFLTTVAAVWEQGQDCLVEEYVVGTEYSCPVWERRDGLLALPVLEIHPAPGREFFDSEAKYTDGEAEEIVRTDDDPLLDILKGLAVTCHRALGCRDFSRTDFIVGKNGPVALEVNTIPGLTANSLLPKALRAAGHSLAAFVTECLERAEPPAFTQTA